MTVTVGDDLQGNLTAKVEYDPTDDTAKDSSAMLATPTDKTDKTDGDAVGDGPSTTPGVVTTTGTRPEFTNSYIPPATPARRFPNSPRPAYPRRPWRWPRSRSWEWD